VKGIRVVVTRIRKLVSSALVGTRS